MDCVVANGIAYIAAQPDELWVIDVSDPTNCTRLAAPKTSSTARAVTVAGNYAYVATQSGMDVFNISSPSNCVLAGTWTGPAGSYDFSDVVVVGSTAYLLSSVFEVSVHVVNVSNPTNCAGTGLVSLAGLSRGYRLGVWNGKLYASAGGHGVRSYSSKFPFDSVGVYDSLGTAFATAFSGSYAFVADGSAGLQAVRIGDFNSLSRVGGYDTLGSCTDVALASNYALVADGDQGLEVIDVTVPTNCVRVGGYTGTGASRVTAAGTSAYLLDQSARLQIVDISNPSSIRRLGGYELSGMSVGLALDGDYAYLADAYNGLHILDVSNPTNCVHVGTYDSNGDCRDVAVANGYAYIADGAPGVQVIDVRDPQNCAPVGRYSETNLPATGIRLRGDYAFVLAPSSLRVLTITNPEACQLLRTLPVPGLRSIAFCGDKAYLACNTSGLKVADISAPAACKITRSLSSIFAWDVDAAGGLLYVVTLEGEVRILDAATLATMGSMPAEGHASRVRALGNYAFISVVSSVATSSIQVIDVSNPAASRKVCSYHTPGYAFDLAATDRQVFVADGAMGLSVLDMTLPPHLKTAPMLSGQDRILEITGAAGQILEIEASEDCRNWGFLGSITNDSGKAEFKDSGAPPTQRFYRARLMGL